MENYLKLLHEIPTVNAPALTKKLADFISQNAKVILSTDALNEELLVQIPGLLKDMVKNQAGVKDK